MIPPAFLINLDRAPDRLCRAEAQLREAGVPFERVPATDGAAVDRRHLPPEDAGAWCARFCTDSMLGCALSHVRLWRRVRDEALPMALILEDDVRLVPGFRRKLERALRKVPPHFDVLYLGCFGLCSSETRGIFVPTLPAGLHCYVVSARGARKLAETKVNFHIDLQLAVGRGASRTGLNLFAHAPPLAYQRDMNASSMAAYDFPVTLTPLLAAIRDGHGIPLAYYASVPVASVGRAHVNAWVALALLLGLTGALRPAWAAGFLALEFALGAGPPQLALAGAAFAAGAITRALF